jgi:alkanesulfonate monooxygenase SsuD/methylene tetrahydromethanopterin reductase-like flavin-dependent oxidoreductase (luciferase family)
MFAPSPAPAGGKPFLSRRKQPECDRTYGRLKARVSPGAAGQGDHAQRLPEGAGRRAGERGQEALLGLPGGLGGPAQGGGARAGQGYHVAAPVGGVLAALHEALGLQLVDQEHHRGPVDAEPPGDLLLGQRQVVIDGDEHRELPPGDPVLEHAWLWDHLVPLREEITGAALEGWTLLSALAAQTSRLRLGIIVTSNRLRSPTLLAKMAATVDVIAAGRLDFGIGVGGSRVPGPNPAVREFEAYGVPLVSPGQAVRDLGESLDVIRRMWTAAEPFDYDGPALRLRGAVCEPKPVQRPHPPIMIGGAGDRVLRLVAEHASIWNCAVPSLTAFRDRDRVLREQCAAIGRDPDEIVRSAQTVVRCDDPAEPAATREWLREAIDAGITHLVLAPLLGDRPVRWLADEIIEPVLAGARESAAVNRSAAAG